MNYTLHQLQVFLKIAKTGSITKASEELYVSQPAVSIQLKKFQEQFDIPLTEIVGRKLYVTEFGKEIVLAAEAILRESEAISHKALAYKGILTGSIKISVVSTGKYVMPYFLTDFIKKHEGVNLIMDVTNKSKVIETLENNEVDFALVSVLPEKLSIDKVELLDNILYLIGSETENFRSKKFNKKLLESIPLIYREPGSGTRFIMENFIEKNKLSVKKKMELTSNEAVKQAVLAGLGYSIMPVIGIKNELINGSLKIIPIQDLNIKSKWSLIWLKEKKLSPIALEYLKFLKKEKAEIIENKFSWLQTYL